MAWTRQLILLLLVLLAARGAESAEDRAFSAACTSFEDQMWLRAENEFGDFVRKYRKSARIPEAVLLQARARIHYGDHAGAVDVLQEHQDQAGALADSYLFWTAEAYYQEGRFTDAARLFARLLSEFPSSDHALDAALGRAAALARLMAWSQVVQMLQDPEGPIQRAFDSNRVDERVARGQLLLAEAQLVTENPADAKTSLAKLAEVVLEPTSEWRGQYLLCRAEMDSGNLPSALQQSAGLLELAGSIGDSDLSAESHLLRGEILERLDSPDEAIAAYRQNLSTNVPPEAQRRSLARLSELWLERDRLEEAREALEQFVAQEAGISGMDAARLTLGEIKLREYVTAAEPGSASTNALSGAATNLLAAATADFNYVVENTVSPTIRGKALLNRGWCLWLAGDYASSAEAFRNAVDLLSMSREKAIAQYKLADAYFREGEFRGALTNYAAVVRYSRRLDFVQTNLAEPSLYQMVRAGLELDDDGTTTNALSQLLESYPEGFYTDRGVLLAGQRMSRTGNPSGVRRIFKDFLQRQPDAPLTAEIRLAIGRTYEHERKWTEAIHEYESFLQSATNPVVRARAEYFRALDTHLAGQETNAFQLFTNFVAHYPDNELAPLAQWWVADHYWRGEDYESAERDYQLLFKQWPSSELAYEARMMAGRAAMARLSPNDAIPYFTNLTSDLSCPSELRARAAFAYGDALMRLPSSDTNNPHANFEEAIPVFGAVQHLYPSNELAILAQGKIGSCYLQLGVGDARNYTAASNAYQAVIDASDAGVTARSEAEVGIGAVLERLAQEQTGGSQSNLLWQAMDHYLNVFYRKNLREQEQADLFWVKKSGLEAGRLAESLGAWPQALRIYRRLELLLPPLRPLIENKILRVEEQMDRSVS